jgi:hypothetical protein
MRKIFIGLALLCYVFVSNAQSPNLKKMWKLYDDKKYEKLIEFGTELLKKDSMNIEYNFWVGRAYYREDEIDKAFPHFLKAAQHNDPHSTIRARANIYLGIYYFFKEDKEKSKEVLDDSRKIETYSNIEESSEMWYEMFGFDQFYNDWSLFETDHFRFYFQDTTDINYKRFISDCELAFTNINLFFESEIPKKIDYFIWGSRIDAKNILKRNLSFTGSYLCYIHGGNNETEGHEIAHDIAHYCTEIDESSHFISEGTATYFDQTNLDRKAYFEELTDNTKKKKIFVKDVWENWYDYSYDFSYNMAGLFVEELIKKYGREKFIEFYSNQTYKNALEVFGKDFSAFTKKFELDYNLIKQKEKSFY